MSIQKCLFPVAGYGTRFLPATKAMPKEMMPILNKPILQYGVEEALHAAITNMVLVTGRGKQAVQEHFDINHELEHKIAATKNEQLLHGLRDLLERCTFSYTPQRHIIGVGDAILSGRHLIGSQPFAVVLPDNLCLTRDGGESALAQLVRLYAQHQCTLIAVAEVAPDQVSKYGIIQGKAIGDGLYEVTDMVEKPAPAAALSNLAIIGRYILSPDIFDILASIPPGSNNEIQLTDALQIQAKQARVMACVFRGHWFDCGAVEGFVDATNYCFEHCYDA